MPPLTGRLRIALSLDERPASVRQPVHLVQRVSGTEFQLAAESDIAEVFATMDESMLVLGAPGAGKTTQLLDLAAALVRRARTAAPGDTPAIPVVVDLAEWSRSGMRRFVWLGSRDRGPIDFARWLLHTLERRYRIPESVSRAWLTDGRLVWLLDGLDGLDEVREADRERCVQAINSLQERHGVTRLAVCCRVADYHGLAEQLRLQGAVEIRLVNRKQVETFLLDVNPRLTGVSALLAADEQLWELLTTPLMLTIMVIAEEGRTVTALAEGADAMQRRRLLFDAYLIVVLARRRAGRGWHPMRVVSALQVLAKASVLRESGVRVAWLDDRAGGAMSTATIDVMRLWLSPLVAFAAGVVPVAVMSWRFSSTAAFLVAGLSLTALALVASGLVLHGEGQRPGPQRRHEHRDRRRPPRACRLARRSQSTRARRVGRRRRSRHDRLDGRRRHIARRRRSTA